MVKLGRARRYERAAAPISAGKTAGCMRATGRTGQGRTRAGTSGPMATCTRVVIMALGRGTAKELTSGMTGTLISVLGWKVRGLAKVSCSIQMGASTTEGGLKTSFSAKGGSRNVMDRNF